MIDNTTKSHIMQLQAAAKQNRLVVFVGAGVSASAGVPAWKELIEKFKGELPDEMFDLGDVLKTAQAYKELRGDVEYLKEIKKILKYEQTSCNQIHDAIMQLNPCHIITTNYDDLLEQSALRNNKQYYVVSKDAQLPANQGEKMLIKMHGDFDEGNIVLTENDYFDYSRNFPLIRSFLLSLFCTKVVLFVGFSFNDINLKYILRQIASILDSNMQRVYLLVDKQKDALAHSYFLKKGIQLLCLPKDRTTEILQEQKIEYSNNGLADNRAIALNQGLSVIHFFDPYYNDIIGRAIKFLKDNSDQIRYWGSNLKFIFPIGKRTNFYLSQQELSLPHDYQEWFKGIIASDESKIGIRNKYGSDLNWLIDRLIENKITTIEGYRIIKDEDIEKRQIEDQRQTVNLVYSLAFDEMDKRLKELKKHPMSYTIVDLELPYLLYKIGRYYDAYLLYKQLAPEMWKRRKYILYFLCLYNQKALFSKVAMQILSRRDVDFDDWRKEIVGIDLKNILTDLPIEQSVKGLLEELESGALLKNGWIDVAKLNDELESQRKSAEKGGMSINSNIVKLLDNFDQSFFFCNENYILTECYDYAREAYEKMAEGIVNSIMTPDNEKWQTKLDELLSRNVLLFVFMVSPDKLKKILSNLANKPIPAEKDFVDTLVLLVKNMVEDLSNPRHQDLINPSIVADYLKNLIIILNAIENPPVIEGIYTPIIHYWFKGRYVEFANELGKLYSRQKPSAEECIKLIDNALHSTTLGHARGIDNLISNYAYTANQEGKVLGDFISIEQITGINNIILEASFLMAIPEKYRQALINHLREKVSRMYDLCIMEIHTNAHIINPETIEKLKDTLSTEDNIHYWTEELTCDLLNHFSEQEEYKDIHASIDELRAKNKCLQYISSPLDYPDRNDIKGSWLIYTKDDSLKVLLQDPTIRSSALQFCNETPWYTPLKERVLKLMNKENQSKG